MIAQKSKTKLIVIISVSVTAFIAVCAGIFILMRGMRLDNALKNLDVADEGTVIRVMKYGGKDAEAVKMVASAYIENADYGAAARFLLYSLQYLSSEDETCITLLKDCYARMGADEIFLKQFDDPDFAIADFEPMSVYEGKSYGFSNGVYVSFCGGYAQAKISSVIPVSVAADRAGVYVLDSSDKLLKFLSDTGLELFVVNDTRMNEFILLDGQIYYIDEFGIPYGTEKAELADGEFAAGLRRDDGAAVCTIYDSNYNELRNITLK
ncbi:MAG: hypothetical protein J6K66_07400 [Clostridia bacterium]|nr:hypothetical protein [Clostridia bacterium]